MQLNQEVYAYAFMLTPWCVSSSAAVFLALFQAFLSPWQHKKLLVCVLYIKDFQDVFLCLHVE